MKHSEQLNELGQALAKAQGAMEHASKDKTNPHFKSKYADLSSVWDAIREPLAKNGLSVVQLPFTDEQGRVHISTMLLHSSGQWIEASYSLPATKPDAQGFGSAITYMKRYALTGMGVAPEDDDGNAAAHREPVTPYSPNPQPRGNGNNDPRLAAFQWTKTAENTVREFKALNDLRAWDDKNNDAMVKLKSVSPESFARLSEVISEQYAKLSPLNA